MNSQIPSSANRLNAQPTIGQITMKAALLGPKLAEGPARPTPRQMRANRDNAKKSTGPRTAAGKVRSSLNAVVHGLSANRCLLPHENPKALQEIRTHLYLEYPLATRGGFYIALIELAASLIWQLMRVGEIQADLFRHHQSIIKGEDERFAYQQGMRYPPVGVDPKHLYTPGRTFERMLEKDEFAKTSRYAAHLQKQLLQILKVLNEETPPPAQSWMPKLNSFRRFDNGPRTSRKDAKSSGKKQSRKRL
jgi:hypothetical protein